MTILLLSVILRRPPTGVDEESINNSFILFKILHSASLHSEWHLRFPCHFEEFAKGEWRRILITILSCSRDSSSPSASQNDNSASFCHSEEFRRKANDEESKIHSFILFKILHFTSFHSEWLYYFFLCHLRFRGFLLIFSASICDNLRLSAWNFISRWFRGFTLIFFPRTSALICAYLRENYFPYYVHTGK